MSQISVRNLWKEYDDKVVLERVSIEIEARAFIALVGPAGCGKTTFLRILLSEETLTRGQILIEGQPIALEPGADRGVVFQRYSVFPHLTTLENVMLGPELKSAPLLGRLFGGRRQQIRKQALELLENVGLAHAIDQYPSQLSGGMQQRLALAQAIICRPKILLLDEPFGALDPGIRHDIHKLMSKLWHDYPLTVVMVTHDLREAFSLATRVIAFDKIQKDPNHPEAYGATISDDIEVWPRRIAGHPPLDAKNVTPGAS